MNDNMHGDVADETNPSTSSKGRAGVRGENDSDAQRLASRRRLLLRGIGKGSALLAATVSIKTLASTPSVTANGQICTASGTQSAAHSQPKGLPICGGLKPLKYKTLANWPNYPTTSYTVGIKTFNQDTNFSDVFGGGQSVPMLEILNSAESPEFHWIAALLNAIKAPPKYVFPYSAAEVLTLYSGTQSVAALTFFTGYMETI